MSEEYYKKWAIKLLGIEFQQCYDFPGSLEYTDKDIETAGEFLKGFVEDLETWIHDDCNGPVEDHEPVRNESRD
jgi:hypothetical protein